MEDYQMTDKQFQITYTLARLEELSRLEERTTDPETLAYIEERKKALRAALESL